MSFPADWTQIRVYGTYLMRDGSAASGQVVFSSPQIVVADGAIVLPKDFIAPLDSAGAISLLLPATDDPDVTPQGWAYTVREHIAGTPGRFFAMAVDANGGDIDMATVSPVVAPSDLVSTRGLPGPPGPGLVTNGSVPTYADLPTLTLPDAGRAYLVDADELIYIWSGTSWPASGTGLNLQPFATLPLVIDGGNF